MRFARLLPVATVLAAAPALAAELRVQQGIEGPVRGVAFTPDGRYALAAGQDRTIRMFEVASGQEIRVFSGHGSAINQIAVSPDGKLLLSASSDKTLRLWDLASGKLVRTLTGHRDFVVGAAFTPDGRRVVSGGADGGVFVYDTQTGRVSATLAPGDGFSTVQSLALAPDGSAVAVGLLGENTVLFDVASGQRRVVFRGSAPAFTPDGLGILVGGESKIARFALPPKAPKGVFAPPRGAKEDFRHRGPGPAEITGMRKVLHVVVSPDGRFALAGGWDKRGRVYELETGKLVRELPADDGFVNAVAISRDGTLALTGSASLRLWSLETGALLRDFSTQTDLLQAVRITDDGRRLLAGGIFGTVAVWDLAALRQISFVPSRGSDSVVGFSTDGTRAIVRSDQRSLAEDVSREARLVDAETGGDLPDRPPDAGPDAELKAKMSAAYPDPNPGLPPIFVPSPDGSRVASGPHRGPVNVWDARTRTLVRALDAGHDGSITAIGFGRDGKLLATGGQDTVVKVWDLSTGKLVRTLRGHRWTVKALDFSPDGRLLASASSDGTVRLWRLDRDASAILMSSRAGEWVVATDDGIFDASANGAALLGMVDGSRGFGVDQLAARNNRPDLLLERMGLGAPELVAHYRRLHERRLEKLGLDARALGADVLPPVVLVEGTRRLDERTLELTLVAESRAGLGSVQLYANGVALFPGVGRKLTGKKQRLVERIALVPGANAIEASVMSVSGQESLRALVSASAPDGPRELYFLGFGVSRYADERIADLSYAHQDVLDLARAFQGRPGFAKVHVKTATDTGVTRAAIESARRFVAAARPEDVVVLFIAGHGLHDDARPPSYYFLTHDAKPDRLAETAAPFALFEELLAGVVARQKLFLMDTCESGERDDGDALAGEGAEVRLAARGLRAEARAEGRPTGRRPWLLWRDRFIERDLTRRTGAVVLSSSRGAELSYENAALENGLFTEALLSALGGAADEDKSGAVDPHELRRYVAREVARLSGGRQHPTVDRDNLWSRLSLPVAGR